jgi:hypothetical protein
MPNLENSQKWVISAWSVLVVFLIFNPITYFITNYIFTFIGAPTTQNTENTENGPFEFRAPTLFGFVLHMVVFLLLIRGMMEIKLPGQY